jgi:hypothetical protein
MYRSEFPNNGTYHCFGTWVKSKPDRNKRVKPVCNHIYILKYLLAGILAIFQIWFPMCIKFRTLQIVKYSLQGLFWIFKFANTLRDSQINMSNLIRREGVHFRSEWELNLSSNHHTMPYALLNYAKQILKSTFTPIHLYTRPSAKTSSKVNQQFSNKI